MAKLNVMSNVDSLNRTLFIGDNLPVLRAIDSESIDLIATDPPFNKGVKAFQGIVTAGMDRKGKKVSYKDVWTWGDVQSEWTESIRQDHPNLYAVIQAANASAGEDMGAFICWLGVRVLAMHRILKPTGSIYLHIDDTAQAYVKVLLDAIFGRENFRNEIVWQRTTAHNDASRYGANTDRLLFYTKGPRWIWNPQYMPHDDAYKARFRFNDEDGRQWSDDNLTAKGLSGGGYEYEYKGARSLWRVPLGTMKRLDSEGRLHFTKKGGIRRKRYLDETEGRLLQALWTDIDPINSQAKERTGYPTQKPLALYERIIKASSNPGDVVLDPFAGCATTCVAAERLGRGWIAIDINEEAKDVVLTRLRKEAQLPQGKQSWNRAISVKTRPPKRTDDGQEAAPELTLVSPQPRAPRLTARALRERLVLADGMRCQGCGWVPHHEEYLEVDHRVPKSREGRDDVRNRVLLCSPCNGTKGNKLTLPELRLQRIEEGRMADKTWNMAWYERTGRFG